LKRQAISRFGVKRHLKRIERRQLIKQSPYDRQAPQQFSLDFALTRMDPGAEQMGKARHADRSEPGLSVEDKGEPADDGSPLGNGNLFVSSAGRGM
jgi:hypothetical protein